MKLSLKNFSLKGAIIIVLAAIMGAFIPYVIKEIVDNEPRIFYFIDNKLLLVLAFVLEVGLSTWGSILFVMLSGRNAVELKTRILNHLMEGNYRKIDELSIGKIPSHLVHNVAAYLDYVSNAIPMFISGIFTICLSVAFLFALDWKLTLALLVSLPLVGLVIVPISSMANRYTHSLQMEMANFSEKLINIFQNILYVRSLNAEEEIEGRMYDYNERIRAYNLKSRKLVAFINPFMMAVLLVIVSVIFIYGGRRVSQGTISVGVLISFLVYVFQLLRPVSSFSKFFAERAKVKTNLDELAKYLDIEIEETEGELDIDKIDRISFENVNFSYGDKPVLKNLSLEIGVNERVALVGPSGSGKSTFYKLLMGFYQPDSGTIKLGGRDIRKLSKKGVRELVSFIPQENSIVYSNLLDYFRLGKQDASPAEIMEALSFVALDRELDLDEEGLEDYDIGVGGSKLSTGQKQRLMIAKAMMKKTDVYLFDESTSSLDPRMEAEILKLQSLLAQGKILILNTHRLSNIKYLDRVIFFEDGSVTGDDSHDNLYRNHEGYRTYIDLQNI